MVPAIPRSSTIPFILLAIAFNLITRISPAEEERRDDPLAVFLEEFVEIRPGEEKFPATYSLGSQDGPETERPVIKITLTRPFRISRYEVWQDLYEAVQAENPSRWRGPRNSAEQMTWHQAREFCDQVTKQLREEGLIKKTERVRLPTEAEWEYCCRAGTSSPYSFGDNQPAAGEAILPLDRYAWHQGNAAGNDPAVGALEPNPWGLYDMHGYLAEYCEDDWVTYAQSANRDPHQPVRIEQDNCVIRGGSWRHPAEQLRSTHREPFSKRGRSDAVGFRCVLIDETGDGTHAPGSAR